MSSEHGKDPLGHLRSMFEVGRRRQYARGEFAKRQQIGLTPGWITCGFCSGQTIYSRLEWRQHLSCLMCGGQMIAQITTEDDKFQLVLYPVVRGPPYREWSVE